jgi:hypothetical protein
MAGENVSNSGEVVQAPPATPKDAPGGGTQPATGGERTFTQAELDRILGDRLARDREKYADYDTLKAAAAELEALKEAEKTELEKAKDAATKAQAERDAALAKAQDTLIRAAFVTEAAKAGAAHPEDAYALADRAGVKVAEDGTITGVAEAVKVLVEGGRLVMSKRPAPNLDGGAGSGNPPGGETPLSAEELAAAKKMGLTPEQYAKGKKKKE